MLAVAPPDGPDNKVKNGLIGAAAVDTKAVDVRQDSGVVGMATSGVAQAELAGRSILSYSICSRSRIKLPIHSFFSMAQTLYVFQFLL